MKIKINKRDVVHGAMELIGCIPVVFDDIYTYWPNDDQTGNESVEK